MGQSTQSSMVIMALTKDSLVSANVIHSDPVNDLVVLKVESATPDFLPVALTRSVKTGDRVFTIGFPMSSLLGEEAKYTIYQLQFKFAERIERYTN